MAENGITSPDITDVAELSCYIFDTSSGKKFDLRSLEKKDGDYKTETNDHGVYIVYNFCSYVDSSPYIAHSSDAFALRVREHGHNKYQTDDSVSAEDFSIQTTTDEHGDSSVASLTVTRAGGE